MFRVASRLVHTIPSRYVMTCQRSIHNNIHTNTRVGSIRAFASMPASPFKFSSQQHQQQQQQQGQHHQQHQHQNQHDQSWSWRASSRPSSSTRIILFSSTAALVAVTGLTMYDNSSHVHAAPLTHNHPHNPIELTTPKDSPVEVIAADLVIASRWRRFFARLFDTLIQGCICQIGQTWFPANIVAVIVTASYDLLLNVYNDGQTLGKMAMSVRTVKDSGDSVDLSSAFLNWLGTAFFTILGGVDALWSICNISGDYKCLHNVISGTIVVAAGDLAAEEKRKATQRYHQQLADAALALSVPSDK